MERRSLKRTAIAFNVQLYKGDTLVVLAQVRDISSGGMYIKTNALTFPIASRWEVIFDYVSKRISMPISVIHRSIDGIGVKFERDGASVLPQDILSELQAQQLVV